MNGLNGRVMKLEQSFMCPTHKVRLTCPQCERGEVANLTIEERAAKIMELLELARAHMRAAEMAEENAS